MGQHKYNPTAIAAKNGELPPKPPKFTKRQRQRALCAQYTDAIYNKFTEVCAQMNKKGN